MSLVKRLWIVIVAIILATILTAGIINIRSAQRYLENELKVKNLDTATALALTLSHSASDLTTAELLLSSQFDLGHYQRIDYLGPDGQLIVRRERQVQAAGAPAWFVQMFPITPDPGQAEIQSGWRQLGSIRLYSNPGFAYDSLWHSALVLVQLFSLGGVLVGGLAMTYLRRELRPLQGVVTQAEALAERRYIEIKPPRTLEFRLIIEAMNRLTQKTKTLLDDESVRLQKLKSGHEIDPSTGFMMRDVFRRNITAEIAREDTSDQGLLLLVHVANLEELNREIGRLPTDALIAALAAQMREVLNTLPSVRYGRLSASDLGALLPGQHDSARVVQRLHAGIMPMPQAHLLVLRYGVARYALHSDVSELLSLCDQSLADVDAHGTVAPLPQGTPPLRSAREWSDILAVALREHEFQLALFPVRASDMRALHLEAPARLHSSVSGETLVAGAFLPWARRQGLVGQVDLEILALTLLSVQESGQHICINLGYESVCDDGQVQRIVHALSRHKTHAHQVCFDVAEDIAFDHPDLFRRFCAQIQPLGCRIGVEHLDRHVGHLGRLHGLGVHYIKLSQALIQGVAQEASAQTLLRSLCTIAHAMGMQVIAEGVSQSEDVQCLFDLGFDGITGSAVV